jgi:propane 2-monooxygenase small subunit
MLVYSRVLGEAAPEAFVLTEDDPTVADLLARVGAARSAQGRLVELDLDGAVDTAKLRDLGVGDGDLVAVRATGEPTIDTTPTVKPDLDIDALISPADGKRRLNEYEEVTRLLQWHEPFHVDGGRPSQKVWSDDSTELRCSDWEAYRTPDKLYYRTYTTRQARAGRSVATAFEFAEQDKQLANVDPARVDLLRNVVGVLQYPDWGLCVTHQQTTRFALSSWIAGATSFMMFDELRHAQLYGRLALAYGEHHDGFDDPRPAWMESPRFQPTRRVIEEVLATLDWGKAIVLADLIVEPLHTAAAHSLLTTGSLAAGDGLTPFVCRSIEDDKVRHRESAVAFLRLLTEDSAHGEHNRALISAWVSDLVPRAHAAAVSVLGGDAAPHEALAEATTWISAQLNDAGIDVPAIDLEHKGVLA